MAKLKPPQSIKGMHDILPAEQVFWQFIYQKATELFADYGFEKIDTPVVEAATLFWQAVGQDTDIVDKEMYVFKTGGDEELALRPENTASIARAFIEHGMQVLPQPVKLWYWGPMFRHDQPQAGRYRQFFQSGLELLGDGHPAADAEVIFVALGFLQSLGLKKLCLKINSLGDEHCRPVYLKLLKDFLKNRSRYLCATCRLRQKTSPLRVLDCKVENCREVGKEAPQLLDHLDERCREHFKKVIEFLDEIKAPYTLDPFLVRGLNYYTHTVFEISLEEKGEEKDQKFGPALVAGGRYNGLISLLGGPSTPAVGWAAGIERIISVLKQQTVKIPENRPPSKIFIAQLGDLGKKKSLVLFEEFRQAGLLPSISLGRDSIKAQLRVANRLEVKLALIIGQKEALDGTVIVREMHSGIQEVVSLEEIIATVKKKLKVIKSTFHHEDGLEMSPKNEK